MLDLRWFIVYSVFPNFLYSSEITSVTYIVTVINLTKNCTCHLNCIYSGDININFYKPIYAVINQFSQVSGHCGQVPCLQDQRLPYLIIVQCLLSKFAIKIKSNMSKKPRSKKIRKSSSCQKRRKPWKWRMYN